MQGRQADPGGLESDLQAFGIQGVDTESLHRDGDREFLVLPENWDAVLTFLKCATQWRYAGMTGVRTGLDYTAVDVVIRMSELADPAKTFSQLQTIESGALEAFREQQD